MLTIKSADIATLQKQQSAHEGTLSQIESLRILMEVTIELPKPDYPNETMVVTPWDQSELQAIKDKVFELMHSLAPVLILCEVMDLLFMG